MGSDLVDPRRQRNRFTETGTHSDLPTATYPQQPSHSDQPTAQLTNSNRPATKPQQPIHNNEPTAHEGIRKRTKGTYTRATHYT